MDDDADAKMIVTAAPPDNWKIPPGRPCIMCLKTIQRDLRAGGIGEIVLSGKTFCC